MIAVEVRDEDARDLAEPQVCALNLVLRRLAAVEEPDLRALREPERHAGDVAHASRDARAGA